jgi:hypothetical protein
MVRTGNVPGGCGELTTLSVWVGDSPTWPPAAHHTLTASPILRARRRFTPGGCVGARMYQIESDADRSAGSLSIQCSDSSSSSRTSSNANPCNPSAVACSRASRSVIGSPVVDSHSVVSPHR